MPELVLHGEITKIGAKSFWVLFKDDDDRRSTAIILKSDVPEAERPDIVIGNTLIYKIEGDVEIVHVTKLKIWTQEDEDNARKRVDPMLKFLDEIDKND